MSPDVLVAGGGCAGLAAATALAADGARVLLLEARQTLGGRSRSWVDDRTGDVRDNGQHVMLVCYDEFLAFVRRTGGVDGIAFQDRLELRVRSGTGAERRFRPAPLPAPFDVLWALVRLGGVSPRTVLGAGSLLREARRGGPAPGTMTAADWLSRHAQHGTIRQLLWDPIVLATINLAPETACASVLAPVLARALGAGTERSRIGFPRNGLDAVVAGPASRYLREHGAGVSTGSPVLDLEVRGGRVAAVRTRDGTRHEAGRFILAVPHRDAARLLPEGAAAWGAAEADALGASAIVEVHLWFDRRVAEQAMIGLLDSPFDWVFDRGYLAMIASAADDLAARDNDELVELGVREARRFLPAAGDATLRQGRVVKERAATPRFDLRSSGMRPGAETSIPNLFLAGDWTDTGLPATLEGAAASGHRAASLATR